MNLEGFPLPAVPLFCFFVCGIAEAAACSKDDPIRLGSVGGIEQLMPKEKSNPSIQPIE